MKHHLTLLFVSLTILTAAAGNWPSWRGPTMTGVASEQDLPQRWSKTENVRWRIELPGPGNSSPIVWGGRVFVSQAVQKENRRTLMCFDRTTGKRLWQSGVTYADPEPTSENNPYCSGSPATDGERVYVCFGSAGVYAYDFDGKETWQRNLGKLNNAFGSAVSPILAGDLCILSFGPDAKARVIAFNKKTGETAWEVEPPKPDETELQASGPGGPGGPGGGPGGPGRGPGDRGGLGPGGPEGPGDGRGPGGRGPGGPGGRGGVDPARGSSWSTPIVINAGGREEVVLSTACRLTAYDPASGKQLWMSKGLGASIYTSPVWGEGKVFAMTSGPGGGAAIAVKPGGSGDVTESHRVWRLDRLKSAIGSGVIHEGHLFLIGSDGIALCLDMTNGKTIWEERLRGSGARGSSWSSMLLADGRIYVPNQSGDVFVLRASPKFEVIATNSVDESTNASLAAASGDLFLRTDRSLWCFKRAE
jgi:outer membrane protein assembly factor BamB